MSSKRRPGNPKPASAPRSNTSILTIAFAIAMAFFLVIGAVAVAIPELFGGDGEDRAIEQQLDNSFEDESQSEEEELRQRLEEDPEDDSAMAQLAVLLANTGRMNESITWYERALEHRPDDTSLRVSFARALEQQGYDLDAEIQFERVLEEDPENEEAMFLLAEIMLRDDPPRQDEADELYEQILEVAPESFYAQMAQDRLDGGPDAEADSDQD